ncbi:MAG: segregation/condensation protein A [Chloroflexi bacterium]|nr:segregation/condensation protein A [Chloroflexota bacterium]
MSKAISPYRVTLEAFEGPLDLLLRLIERQELEITRISLALVTNQYLDYLAQLEHTSAENLADFLVVAAKLLVIKSRSLLPPPVSEMADEADETGEQLAQQLAEYKRFKQTAEQLRSLEKRGWHTYLRLAPAPRPAARLMLGSLDPECLVQALVKAASEQPVLESVDAVVQPVQVFISDCINTILGLLSRSGTASMDCAFHNASSRLEVIVLFLAMLELVKQQRIYVEQKDLFGEITLATREPDPDAEHIDPTLEGYGDVGVASS